MISLEGQHLLQGPVDGSGVGRFAAERINDFCRAAHNELVLQSEKKRGEDWGTEKNGVSPGR